MMRRRLFPSRVAMAAATALSFAGGCSKSEFELAPVAGKVLIDGQPFTEGKVMFSPIAKGEDHMAGRFAIGRVDSSGQFTLGTYKPGDGAVVGQHWVTLIHVAPEPDEFGGAQPASKPAAAKFDRLTVPDVVTVAAGEDNRIDISVTREQLAKLGQRVN